MKNLLYIGDNDYAQIAIVYDGEVVNQIETTRLNVGKYIKIDDGNQYPQLCVNASRVGNTLEYASPEQLARDCNARLYKTEAGFKKAIARLPNAFAC